MEDDPCPTTSLSNHYQRSIVYCVVVPSLHYVVYRLYINGVVSADPGCARGSVTNVSLWVLLALAIFHLWFYNPWQFLQLWFRPRPETQYTKHLQTATRSQVRELKQHTGVFFLRWLALGLLLFGNFTSARGEGFVVGMNNEGAEMTFSAKEHAEEPHEVFAPYQARKSSSGNGKRSFHRAQRKSCSTWIYMVERGSLYSQTTGDSVCNMRPTRQTCSQHHAKQQTFETETYVFLLEQWGLRSREMGPAPTLAGETAD